MPQQAPWSSTHPFIGFELNVETIPAETWALLGECSSKLDHIANIPLKPKVQARLSRIYLARGAHGTTAIEGNTLSEKEVVQRIAGKLPLPDSLEYHGAAVDNIVKCYNEIIARLVDNRTSPVCNGDIAKMNREVLEGLPVEDGVTPGEFRSGGVGVGNYGAPERRHVEELMDRFCRWMNNEVWEQQNNFPRHTFTILKAIVAHVYFAWIHPFGDGNGRTARLIEFDILTRHGAPPMSAHVLSDYYNRTRPEYYRALDRARMGIRHFVAYAVKGLAEGLREQLTLILRYQVHLAWESFVSERFKRLPSSAPNNRRRLLAIELAGKDRPQPIRKLPELSVELAALYGTEQRKVQRDVNNLIRLGLVRRQGGGVVAATDAVRSFIPFNRRVTSAPEIPTAV